MHLVGAAGIYCTFVYVLSALMRREGNDERGMMNIGGLHSDTQNQ